MTSPGWRTASGEVVARSAAAARSLVGPPPGIAARTRPQGCDLV
ncbi:hypothetical protein P1S61_25580 [Streptomyces sp. ME08-AFT2]|nr:hypothetical protein [Streptomyces sp. ME08-AFT2]MDX3312386.1 hypothetical protein [Streptomyces sp. ME08-AFT2]